MKTKEEAKDCFVIMPIADAEGYPDGHFGHVYKNIIQPACHKSGFTPVRADEVKETNLIHLDILKKLIEAPMAICDLSNRNPNVLFELGIRQAFDRPVVLIQEKGTPKIFDIAPLRYLEYSQEMKYHDVLAIQEELRLAIEATASAESDSSNINSIVKLLALSSPANIPDLENGKESLALDVLQAEMKNMRSMLEMTVYEGRHSKKGGSIGAIEYERISAALDKLLNTKRMALEEKHSRLRRLMMDADELIHIADSDIEHNYFRRLLDRVRKAEKEIFL